MASVNPELQAMLAMQGTVVNEAIEVNDRITEYLTNRLNQLKARRSHLLNQQRVPAEGTGVAFSDQCQYHEFDSPRSNRTHTYSPTASNISSGRSTPRSSCDNGPRSNSTPQSLSSRACNSVNFTPQANPRQGVTRITPCTPPPRTLASTNITGQSLPLPAFATGACTDRHNFQQAAGATRRNSGDTSYLSSPSRNLFHVTCPGCKSQIGLELKVSEFQ